MKRLLTTIFSIFFLTNCAFAIEDVILLQEEEPNFVKEEIVLEHSEESFMEKLLQAPQIMLNAEVQSVDKGTFLLKDLLYKEFESGPLDSLHTLMGYMGNIDGIFKEGGDTYSKYNPQYYSILFNGEFRGNKEAFRIMLGTSQLPMNFFHGFFQDVWIESRRIPHHRLFVGNFRTSSGYEGAFIPFFVPFAYRSQVSRHFSNVRKVGANLHGDFKYINYDLGGYSSDTFFQEFFPGAEFSGMFSLKPLADNEEKYGKMLIGGAFSAGERNSVAYTHYGAHLKYNYKKFHTTMEYAKSNGSNGSTGLTNNRGEGFYATLGYFLTPKVELLARYDEFDPNIQNSGDKNREYTAGVNYYIMGQGLKLMFNYVYAQNDTKMDTHKLIFGTQIVL